MAARFNKTGTVDEQAMETINALCSDEDDSVKVVQIESTGLTLAFGGEEYFLSYELFPWFKDADEAAILNVKKQGSEGFCWPDLDVDLSLDGIKNPGDYPLIAK